MSKVNYVIYPADISAKLPFVIYDNPFLPDADTLRRMTTSVKGLEISTTETKEVTEEKQPPVQGAK